MIACTPALDFAGLGPFCANHTRVLDLEIQTQARACLSDATESIGWGAPVVAGIRRSACWMNPAGAGNNRLEATLVSRLQD